MFRENIVRNCGAWVDMCLLTFLENISVRNCGAWVDMGLLMFRENIVRNCGAWFDVFTDVSGEHQFEIAGPGFMCLLTFRENISDRNCGHELICVY